MSVKIPPKSSFKLQEVCELVQIRPYVLRFWESEFDQIQPITSSSGQKIYEHKDITAILHIKELVVERKLPLAEAKKLLATPPPALPPPSNVASEESWQKLVMAKAKLRGVISSAESVQGLLNTTR